MNIEIDDDAANKLVVSILLKDYQMFVGAKDSAWANLNDKEFVKAAEVILKYYAGSNWKETNEITQKST